MFRIIETHSRQQFCSRAVEFLLQKIQEALRTNRTCIVGLSGGTTPKPIYEELGMQNAKCKMQNWGNTHFFLVDERYVPQDHPESNQRMVRETLLARCHPACRPKLQRRPEPVEAQNLVFPNTALPIDACVADYAQRLQELWKNNTPDLVILGMGTDGHIASLFPPLSDLALGNECPVLRTRAPEDIGPKSARDRISLSLGALSSAKEHVLLLQGQEKKRVWEEMLVSWGGERRWPLKRIMETGNLTVFVEW